MSDPSQPSMSDVTHMPPHKRGLAPIAGLLIAVVVGMAVLAIWGAREHAVSQVQQTSRNLAALLAEQTSHTLQAVDRVLQTTADQVGNENIGTPAAPRPAQDSLHLRNVLAEQLKTLPQATALALLDADCRTVAATSSWPPAWRNVGCGSATRRGPAATAFNVNCRRAGTTVSWSPPR